MRQAYFDVKVVSPFARSNSTLSPSQLFRRAEQSKIREYADRIRNVEHADFTPLVFTTTGVMAPQCQQIFKKVGEKIAQVKELPYSVVCGWLRCRFSRTPSYYLDLSQGNKKEKRKARKTSN